MKPKITTIDDLIEKLQNIKKVIDKNHKDAIKYGVAEPDSLPSYKVFIWDTASFRPSYTTDIEVIFDPSLGVIIE